MPDAKPKILIIEDDDTFAGIYRDNFAGAGFDVVMAADGQAGLAAIKEARPAAVILDLMIPEIHGFDLIKEVRALPDAGRLPVIVVTNLDQHEEENRARALGADAYFVKAHATFADVLAKARELLARDVANPA